MSDEPTIDAALVAQLVRSQHPALDAPVTLLDHGWDNDLYRLGAAHLVRLPRRPEAAELVLNEQRWLPTLAGMLPVAVPAPVAVGVPAAGYPWHWSIVPWLDGEPAFTLADRSPLVGPLADALLALHVPAPPDAPRNPVRGVRLAVRDRAVRDRIARVDPTLLPLWERSLAAPVWDGPALWLHGDLHPANVLVRDGRLAALIDFGDVTAGDPATDLAAAWLFFDDPAPFRARLAHVDAAAWERARGWALLMATAFLTGSPAGSPMIPLGHEALDRLRTE